MTPKFAIVVGASSGIGLEIARQLAENGTRVAAVARRQDRLEELHKQFPNSVFPYAHDVKDYSTTPDLFERITKELGGLDLIVYAAGVMPEVGFDEFDFEKDKSMIETNLLGAIAWLNLAANRFQNTKHGTIVGIGSVAGDRGRSGQPAYNTSKAALATYLEALRNRVGRYGVVVVTIKPGPVQTEMTSKLHLKNAMTARDAAWLTLAKSGRTGEHYLKWTHRLIFYILKRVPSPIFRKLKI